MVKSALAGLVILIIGDSHIASKDFLLSSLQDALVNQGAIVHSYGVCGSQPHDWRKAQVEILRNAGELELMDEYVANVKASDERRAKAQV